MGREGIVVAKFGGSSLADAGQFRKVRKIVEADPMRRYIVASAPGKSRDHDHKITDLLYLCQTHVKQSIPFEDVFNHIAQRVKGITRDLGVRVKLDDALALIRTKIAQGASGDYAASRGEYLCGMILADYLGFEFIDAAEVIFFDGEGRLDVKKTQEALAARLPRHKRAVIPGFYGADPSAKVRVFSRGGSDVTGALVARGAGARVYENWTDIPGLRMADPRIVIDAKRIETITYRELRELSYMGATVLHDEAVFPVRDAGIPVHIRSTDEPDVDGTRIVQDAEPTDKHGGLSGIAGRKDFTVIAMEKALMNREIGFGRKALDVLARHGVSYEHTPTGIDSFGIVLSDSEVNGKLTEIERDLRDVCKPDTLEIFPNMALVAVVGRGMARRPGVAAKVFSALAESGINVRMIDQGSSEINIILGVETKDFESSVRAIYRAFVSTPKIISMT